MPVISTSALRNAALGAAGAAVAGIGYASLIERNAFVLREATLPVLEPGKPSLRVLHISDLHMTPGQQLKQAWVRELDRLEPDLVVNTGDNLAHPKAVPSVVQSLGGLLARPGIFIFGSNDYFAPVPKNPLKYFEKDHKRVFGDPLPWQDLRAAFSERGWLDLTHVRRDIEVAGVKISTAGVDDPHLKRDRYDTVAGAPNPLADLSIGLTHSPSRGCWTGSPTTATTWSWPGIRTAASCACRSTARWSPTAASTAPGSGRVALGRAHPPARVGGPGHLAVGPVPVLLPPGGHPPHPGGRSAEEAGRR